MAATVPGALLLSGQTDFGLAGPEVPIYIYNGESPDKPVIFCALTGTDGLFLASRQKIDKFDWSMLNGKKIMGWRPGSTPQLYLEYVLKQNGVAADDHQEHRHQYRHAGARRRLDGRRVRFCDLQRAEHVQDGEGRTGAVSWPRSARRSAARNTRVFFAKKSWIEKNTELAQKWTNAIARAQAWMKTASDEEVGGSDRAVFPRRDDRRQYRRREPLAHRRACRSGPPHGGRHAGLAKVQEIMVVGGVLPADKEVAYEKIVATSYAEKAKQKFARNEEALMLAPSGSARRQWRSAM